MLLKRTELVEWDWICHHWLDTLRWCHNGHGGVSNHQPHHCLLNRLFGCRSKKTSKLRVTGLCAGNSPGTGEFPAQMASNAENVSTWWRHQDEVTRYGIKLPPGQHTYGTVYWRWKWKQTWMPHIDRKHVKMDTWAYFVITALWLQWAFWLVMVKADVPYIWWLESLGIDINQITEAILFVPLSINPLRPSDAYMRR